MTDKVIPFPAGRVEKREEPKTPPTLPISEVETIGFLTADDRSLYISDKNDIERIMAFIVRSKIKIIDEDL